MLENTLMGNKAEKVDVYHTPPSPSQEGRISLKTASKSKNHKSKIINQNMLIKDYYTIESVAQQGGKAVFQIALNPQCQVYEGHFPGEPVSPGVCNIQMIKECAEQVAGKCLFLSNLQQCRLTTLVTPLAHPQVEVTIQLEEKGGAYKLKATLGKGEEIYLDLKAELNS